MRKVILSFVMVAIILRVASQGYDFFDTSFYSPVLDETKSMRIYLPPGYAEDTLSYPVVYYLHGATGTYLEVTEYLQHIQNMIDTAYIHPMLVVGLDGQCDPYWGSMYANSILYGNYEDYLIQDAIPFAESAVRTKDSPNYRCIMGFAMGAYGSMKMGCKHPELFAGLASYNGILQFDTTFVLWLPEVTLENPGPPHHYQFGAGIFTDLLFTGSGGLSPNLGILPYQIELPYDTMGILVDSVLQKWKLHDCSRLAKGLDPGSYHPALFFACGINDFLYFHPTNTCFADTLDSIGIEYEFLSTNDGHILSVEMLTAGMYFLDSVMFDSIWVGITEDISRESYTLSIYPNPSFDYITIETPILPHPGHLSIMNLNGQVFINQKISESITLIDIRNLQRVIYLCCIHTGDQKLIRKVVIL